MKSSKEIIQDIKPFDYSQYKEITSYEKLMVFAVKFLSDNSIPLTFDYICVASYNFFPEVFCLNNEFKQHLSPDRLNRTYMHLKYQKINPYITGNQKEGFILTKFGKLVAEEVANIINNTKINPKVKRPIVDLYKSGEVQNYEKFVKSNLYILYEKSKKIDLNLLWEYKNVIPYTNLTQIKKDLIQLSKYSKDLNNVCYELVNEILRRI